MDNFGLGQIEPGAPIKMVPLVSATLTAGPPGLSPCIQDLVAHSVQPPPAPIEPEILVETPQSVDEEHLYLGTTGVDVDTEQGLDGI